MPTPYITPLGQLIAGVAFDAVDGAVAEGAQFGCSDLTIDEVNTGEYTFALPDTSVGILRRSVTLNCVQKQTALVANLGLRCITRATDDLNIVRVQPFETDTGAPLDLTGGVAGSIIISALVHYVGAMGLAEE